MFQHPCVVKAEPPQDLLRSPWDVAQPQCCFHFAGTAHAGAAVIQAGPPRRHRAAGRGATSQRPSPHSETGGDSSEIQATMNRNGQGKDAAAQQRLCTAHSTACPTLGASPLLLPSWDPVSQLYFYTKCCAALQGGGTSPIISFPPEAAVSQETFISAPLNTGWLRNGTKETTCRR